MISLIATIAATFGGFQVGLLLRRKRIDLLTAVQLCIILMLAGLLVEVLQRSA